VVPKVVPEFVGVKLLVQRVHGLERGPMRELVDQMRGKLGSGVVVLGAVWFMEGAYIFS